MTERNKVIEALEACVLKNPDDSRDCRHCPRCNYGAFITNSCINGVMADALALLKAQEPRVMTLEEVRDEADHMYLEKHSKTGSNLYGCAIRGDWDGYGIELLMGEYDTARERWSDYGKTWCCWTSRPTDEQIKAVQWE